MNTENDLSIGKEDDLFMDQPIEVQSDETDDLIQYDNNFHSGIADFGDDEEDEDQNDDLTFDDDLTSEDSGKKVVPEPAKAAASLDEIDFDDDKVAEEDEDSFKAEEAIEKLKKLGYNVGKDEINDPSAEKLQKVNEIDRVVENIERFINQDDLVLCRQRVIQDLTDDYTKRGLASEINSEDFKADVEAQMDEYTYNTRMASLEAKTIRNEMKQFISEKTAEKETIQKEIEEQKNMEIKNHRLELQKSFKTYKDKTLFGKKLTAEVIQNAYKKMVSGEVAEKVNNDKNIQAEFALFLELRNEISKAGGATYGEGVADTVKALNGEQPATKTSLNRTVQRPSSGNNLHDRYSSWANRTAVKTD